MFIEEFFSLSEIITVYILEFIFLVYISGITFQKYIYKTGLFQ
jgi:hypothetical protein